MPELVQLDPVKHGDLQVRKNASVEQAAKQHILNIRAAEIGKAVCSFPVFFVRNNVSGGYVLSSICSFEPEMNLFVEDGQWLADYFPTGLQTFPLVLMADPADEKQATVGIDPENPAFCKEDGIALFEDDDKASVYLSTVTNLLESDIQNDINSFHFVKKIEELGLMRPVNLQVNYHDDSVNTIQGLHTINEERLRALTPEQLESFNQNGYLVSMYAMLTSTFQLNALIKRHNQKGTHKPIKSIKLETAKDSDTDSDKA